MLLDWTLWFIRADWPCLNTAQRCRWDLVPFITLHLFTLYWWIPRNHTVVRRVQSFFTGRSPRYSLVVVKKDTITQLTDLWCRPGFSSHSTKTVFVEPPNNCLESLFNKSCVIQQESFHVAPGWEPIKTTRRTRTSTNDKFSERVVVESHLSSDQRRTNHSGAKSWHHARGRQWNGSVTQSPHTVSEQIY